MRFSFKVNALLFATKEPHYSPALPADHHDGGSHFGLAGAGWDEQLATAPNELTLQGRRRANESTACVEQNKSASQARRARQQRCANAAEGRHPATTLLPILFSLSKIEKGAGRGVAKQPRERSEADVSCPPLANEAHKECKLRMQESSMTRRKSKPKNSADSREHAAASLEPQRQSTATLRDVTTYIRRACIAPNATSNSESTCVEQENLPRLARREKMRTEKCHVPYPSLRPPCRPHSSPQALLLDDWWTKPPEQLCNAAVLQSVAISSSLKEVVQSKAGALP